MPAAQLKSFAEKSGKSLKKLEGYWEAAKKAAARHGFKTEDPSFWAYVSAIVQRRAGLREELTFKEYVQLCDDINKKTVIQLEPGLTRDEAMKRAPWKKSYGDCRAFSYNAKTGKATWI